jgi:ABC-type uncharacterized transport system substrate-binding protein
MKDMKKPSITYEGSSESLYADSQHAYKTTLTHTMQKLTQYYDKYENNPDMLEMMTKNLKNFENIIDASISPNSFLNNFNMIIKPYL